MCKLNRNSETRGPNARTLRPFIARGAGGGWSLDDAVDTPGILSSWYDRVMRRMCDYAREVRWNPPTTPRFWPSFLDIGDGTESAAGAGERVLSKVLVLANLKVRKYL